MKILIKAIVNLLRYLTAELELFDMLITGSSFICWLELSLPDEHELLTTSKVVM